VRIISIAFNKNLLFKFPTCLNSIPLREGGILQKG
jgi:hypothetical protein